jgi:hypothetical protein
VGDGGAVAGVLDTSYRANPTNSQAITVGSAP